MKSTEYLFKEVDRIKEALTDDFSDVIEAMKKYIDEAIAEKKDVQEARHGKWIEEPNCWYRCSLCGEHYPSIRGYMYHKFCPNCGAKMEGGDEGADKTTK